MADTPIVFISHSTRKLPADDKCVLVKTALVAALKAKGWQAFLDSHSIKGGDQWRTEILHSLATAQAGIILLNEPASQSNWVKAEALIMCFRKSIDPTFPLLPIVLPGANIDATFLTTYEPFEFNEIQRTTVTFAGDESIEEFARNLAENANLERARLRAPSGIVWVEKVMNLLVDLGHDVLGRAAADLELELEPELITPATKEAACRRLRLALANLMHYKQPHECVGALKSIMSALTKETAARLERPFVSKWVENESAETLLHSIQNPERYGLFALNTSQQTIADRYKERVQVEMPPAGLISVFSVAPPNGDYDEDALRAKIDQAIYKEVIGGQMQDADSSELSLIDAVKARLELKNRFALGILPRQYSIASLLSKLRTDFPRIVFIALTGNSGEANEQCIAAGGRTLNPQLTPEKSNELINLRADWRSAFNEFYPPNEMSDT